MPDVVRSALGEPEQIDPRGEDRTCACEDEGTDVLCDAVEFVQQCVKQLDIQALAFPCARRRVRTPSC